MSKRSRQKLTRSLASTWGEILADYDERKCGDCDEDQITWFQRQRSLREAIQVAAAATDSRQRRYSHQFRIPRETIAHAKVALAAAEKQIARAESFDALHHLIKDQFRNVPGAGPLYLYDTAFRIGSYLGIFPERVYLHAGTRAGAKVLGLEHRKETLEMSEIPAELRHRKSHEVEDILCIYKDRFAVMRPAASGGTGRAK